MKPVWYIYIMRGKQGKEREKRKKRKKKKCSRSLRFRHAPLWKNDSNVMISTAPKKAVFVGCLSPHSLSKARRRFPLIVVWFAHANLSSLFLFTLVPEFITTFWMSPNFQSTQTQASSFNLVVASLRPLQFYLEYYLAINFFGEIICFWML